MATYWFYYEWRIRGKIDGENSIKFSASSDDGAQRKAAEILREFQENHPDPDIRYFHIRILKEIRALKKI